MTSKVYSQFTFRQKLSPLVVGSMQQGKHIFVGIRMMLEKQQPRYNVHVFANINVRSNSEPYA